MSTSDPTTTKGDPNVAANFDAEAEAKLVHDALKQMASLNLERAALNAKISKARKQMKADGIELGPLDATLRMMEWSPSEVREHFDIQQRYARAARLPIGTQIDLLSDVDDATVTAGDWNSRGFSAATTGKGVPGVPPKECPPEHHQDWLAGWNDGQMKNAPAKLRIVEKTKA